MDKGEREYFDALEAEIRENFGIRDKKWYLTAPSYSQDHVKIRKALIYLCVVHRKISSTKISIWCNATAPNISHHKKDFQILLTKDETSLDSLTQKVLSFYKSKIVPKDI